MSGYVVRQFAYQTGILRTSDTLPAVRVRPKVVDNRLMHPQARLQSRRLTDKNRTTAIFAAINDVVDVARPRDIPRDLLQSRGHAG